MNIYEKTDNEKIAFWFNFKGTTATIINLQIINTLKLEQASEITFLNCFILIYIEEDNIKKSSQNQKIRKIIINLNLLPQKRVYRKVPSLGPYS